MGGVSETPALDVGADFNVEHLLFGAVNVAAKDARVLGEVGAGPQDIACFGVKTRAFHDHVGIVDFVGYRPRSWHWDVGFPSLLASLPVKRHNGCVGSHKNQAVEGGDVGLYA